MWKKWSVEKDPHVRSELQKDRRGQFFNAGEPTADTFRGPNKRYQRWIRKLLLGGGNITRSALAGNDSAVKLCKMAAFGGNIPQYHGTCCQKQFALWRFGEKSTQIKENNNYSSGTFSSSWTTRKIQVNCWQDYILSTLNPFSGNLDLPELVHTRDNVSANKKIQIWLILISGS